MLFWIILAYLLMLAWLEKVNTGGHGFAYCHLILGSGMIAGYLLATIRYARSKPTVMLR